MRIAGNLDLDGTTLKLEQGGDSTTIVSNSPASDITLTLPSSASMNLVGVIHGGTTSKDVVFDTQGATSAKKLTLDTNHTDNRTLTLPDATDTLVGRATTDTLTNKTLTSPTLTVLDNAFTLQDNGDTTKDLVFSLGGATTGKTATITSSHTDDRTLTLPDATDTLVGKATTDTLTNKTLTSPVIATISNSGDLTLPTGADTLVGRATTDTLTNKTVTALTTSAGSYITMKTQSVLRLEDDSGTDYVGLDAPASVTTWTLTLPAVAPTSASQVICATDTSGNTEWGSALTNVLPSAQIFVGDAAGASDAVDVTGDIAISNTGVTSIASGVIIDADVKSDAAVALTKLAAVTASRALVSDVSGVVSPATTTATEIGYVNGVTSSIQTQLDAKEGTLTNSAGLASALNDESGTGLVVFNDSPTLISPTLTTPTLSSPRFTSAAKVADYPVLDDDDLTTVLMTTSTTDRTVTLPTASANTDRVLTIKKVDSGSGQCAVDGKGSETIDGSTTNINLKAKNDYVTVQCDGTGWHIISQNRRAIAYVRDEKTTTTEGGTFTTGAFRTRTLNTLEGDTSFISLSSSQMTLEAGTYSIQWSCPAYNVDRHQSRLYNTTDTATTLSGQGGYTASGNTVSILSTGAGVFTITGSKVLEVQHDCETTKADNGFGLQGGSGEVEVYTTVMIERLND